MNHTPFWSMVLALTTAGVLAACGPSSTPTDAATDARPDVGNTCAAPRMRCGSVCVDPTSDSANCGMCGYHCGNMMSCTGSVCVYGCTPPTTSCGSYCADLQNDGVNCGTCMHACPTGMSCAAGMCAACPTGQTTCIGHCADVLSDPSNCGMCGHMCTSGVCSGGVCSACSVGQTVCGSTCADLTSDANNCGACGTACTPGNACVGGVCGEPTPDAAIGDASQFEPDGATSPDGGTTGLSLRVVIGPPPLRVVAGVPVRAENASGAMVDGVTEADGIVHLAADPSAGPWSVTTALPGHTAVSVVGITTSVVPGFIRIDPNAPYVEPTPTAISGAISGVLDPADTVQIDSFDFYTVNQPASASSYHAHFVPSGMDLPLVLTALEITSSNHVVNAMQTPALTRGTTTLTQDVAFPSVRPTVVTASTTIQLAGSTGIVQSPLSVDRAPMVEQLGTGAHEAAWALVGVGNTTMTSTAVVCTTETFAGALAPDVAYVGLQDGPRAYQVNAVLHRFGSPVTLTIPALTQLSFSGTTVGDLTFGVAGTGFDTMMLTLSPAGGPVPFWRVYTLDSGTRTAVPMPHLPAGITLASIGLTGPLDALGLAIRMTPGAIPAWGTRPLNSSIQEYELTVGGTNLTVQAAGR